MSGRRTTEASLRENYEKLISALSTGKRLEQLLIIGQEILENPIAIADTSYKILAATPQESYQQINSEYGAAAWESVLTRQMNRTSIQFVKSTKRYDLCIHGLQPHIVEQETMRQDGFDAPCSFLDCSIRIHGSFVAFLSVADLNRPFQPEDLDYCRYLANIVSLELQKNEFFLVNHGIAYEALLNDLLNGKVNDRLQMKLRLQSIDRTLKEDLYVLTVRRIGSKGIEAAVPLIEQSVIRRFFPGSISVIYRNDVVLLVSRSAGESLTVDDEEFLSLMDASHMKVGISEVFHDPMQMRKYYEQSIKAIELGEHLTSAKSPYHYNPLSLFHALEICSKEISLRDLCHPLVATLNGSHDEGDQELLKTLYLWLFCERDVDRITRILHIHRSTLSYRIRKIKDMLGNDMSDGELVFHLMFSFKLIEYYSGFVNPDATYWFKDLPLELLQFQKAH